MRKLGTLAAALLVAGCSQASSNGSDSSSSEYGSVEEVLAAVCDGGKYRDTGDGYDYSCKIEGKKVLVTDWSTFGGASGEKPSVLVINETFTIQGPPNTLDVARSRLSQD